MSNVDTMCKEICCLGDEIRAYLKEIMSSPTCVDAQTAGEYFDMLKDCAEAEAKIREASYYKAVTDAMEESQAISGFNRRGYMPMMIQKPYVDEFLRDPDRFQHEMSRYGYINGMGNLSHDMHKAENEYRHGTHYNNYVNSKRHYTQTHNPEDKEQMEKHANWYVSDVIMTLRDIWDSAEPNHKKRMKSDLQKLLEEMG